MNCEILHTLYVRTNGDVPCNDDAGEPLLLGLIRPEMTSWSASELLFNHRYRHIRDSLARGQMPWPDTCGRCAFFRPNEPFADFLAQKAIRKIQIEPTLACRLRCPGCSNQTQVRVRPQPLAMDLGMFERILLSLRRENFSVAEIEYCGQGEPLLHPAFPEFVRLARRHFPATAQRLITSGNFDFQTATGGERIDEVIVSCDGAFPASYERYRIGGDIEVALRFLRDAQAAVVAHGRGRVAWKYILFEWNDSTPELQAARDLATELGLEWLLFVYTHSAGKSRRYTTDNLAAFPVVGPNVTTNATPIHYQQSPHPQSPEP